MITLIIFTILCTNLIVNCFTVAAILTIKVGDQRNHTSQLVFPDRKFTLGFFTIPATNATYLGIWYTNDRSSRKVWVANPSKPIISSSGILMIDPDIGKLIISTRGTTLVNISDNQSGRGPTLTAALEDTGKFQLKNETDNQILWQSFDHPTNVLLPDMKLGSNLRMGKNWKLTSWLSDDIPDSGAFTLSWELEGENSQGAFGQPYWTSGDLINQTKTRDRTYEFLGLNSQNNMYQYNLSYVYNNEERDFSFHGINGVQPMWVLRPGGDILEGENNRIWTPAFCYGYDSGNGYYPHLGTHHCWHFSTYRVLRSIVVYIKKKRLRREEEERQKRDDEYFLELMASEIFKDETNLESNGRKGSELMVFSFASIVAATDDFASENKLGEGGFGPVFKAWELCRQGDALELEDPTLTDACVVGQFFRTIYVAFLCVQENAVDRPVMSDVIFMLINDTMLLPTLKRPAFFIGRDALKSENYSMNKMTITEMEVR
ncbi:hypothetical protein L6452_32012 [Arctium lappa]|uniref:Uncharacterized protein n=1 Tax=Arctium lappa TaxID=4217 RepID=A0ACB8Z4A4_ARCLA|nr:hypothetical protein L6452_32012 [Arctium lappa]